MFVVQLRDIESSWCAAVFFFAWACRMRTVAHQLASCGPQLPPCLTAGFASLAPH